MPNRRKTKTGAAPLQKCDAGRVRARQLLDGADYVYKDAQQALMVEFECSRRTAQEWIRFAKKQATEDPATIRQRALERASSASNQASTWLSRTSDGVVARFNGTFYLPDHKGMVKPGAIGDGVPGFLGE